MNIEKFKQNIKTWDELRLSKAYRVYCKRLAEPNYALKEELIEQMINAIKDEWEDRKRQGRDHIYVTQKWSIINHGI